MQTPGTNLGDTPVLDRQQAATPVGKETGKIRRMALKRRTLPDFLSLACQGLLR